MANPSPSRKRSRTKPARPLRKYQTLNLSLLEDRSVPAITGMVFQDYNANGVMDVGATIPNSGQGSSALASDRGQAGVTVTAYDASNNVAATAVTNDLGFYSLNVPGNGAYRVEFTSLPLGFLYGPQNVAGSNVQFVNSGNTLNVNLSLVRPEDFSVNNPTIITTQFFFGGGAAGDPNNGSAAIVGVPSNVGSADNDPNRDNHSIETYTLQVPLNQVGATWGLAYDANSNSLFAASYMKRTAGFGPGGFGAVYNINVSNSTASIYADLNSIFGDFPAGNPNAVFQDRFGNNVPYRNNLTGYNWFSDGLTRVEVAPGVFRDVGWDSVGKIGLGGLDVTDDGSTLFTMALGDRRLYAIPTIGTLNSSTVRRFDLPVPAGVTGVTASNPLGDLRPFAVEVHRGIVYIGAVNTAESTQNPDDLKAYVFAFNPVTGQFIDSSRRVTTTAPVFEFALNYSRGHVHSGIDPTNPANNTPADPAAWNPWSPTFDTVTVGAAAAIGRMEYPQPMLTGLSFDADGNLSIGIRDRSGDQVGRLVPSNPLTPNNITFSITAGDTLRAFINAPRNLDQVQTGASFAGWTLENNGRSPTGQGTGPVNNGQGPGGAEYFADDEFVSDATVPAENDEVSMGAVLQLPGFNQSITTAFDPVRIPNAINGGGFRWYDNASGAITRSYELYITPPGDNSSTFAKGNGLGDLVAITAPPPVEIGNFLWNDANANGVQDVGEAGIGNAKIDLYGAGADGKLGTTDDVLLGSAVTDLNGNYIFSSGSGNSTASRIYNLGLKAQTDYELRISGSQAALSGRAFTKQNADGSANGTSRDSNATAAGIVSVRTGLLGEANHNFDIGVTDAPNLSIGDTVWNDRNNDGIKQDTEPGVDNVTVNLLDSNGGFLSTQTTSGGGRYLFTGLSAGNYIVEIVPPQGFVSSTGKGGAYEPGVTDNTNNADHGSNQPGGRIRSGVVVLSAPGSAANPDSNGSANLRVDFGLIRPLSVGNLVFDDRNNDGIRQDSEQGLAGVTVQLVNTVSGETFSTVTNSAGGYLFTNLIEGTYRAQVLRSTLPVGYYSSTGARSVSGGPFEPANGMGIDSTDHGSNAVNFIQTAVINLNYGSQPLGEAATAGGLVDNAADADSNLRQDFGFFRTLSLGNLVFIDGNNDGIRQDTESGFEGLRVELLDDRGTVIGTTTTDSNGLYLFENLFPGQYRVQITGFPILGNDTYWRSSSGAGTDDQNGKVDLRVGPYEPAPIASPSDNRDNGTETIDPATKELVRIQSGLLTLGEFGSAVNPNDNGFANLTLDFGLTVFVPPPPPPPANISTLAGVVYRDIFNIDGKREPANGETGIAGVTVTLTGIVDGKAITPVIAITNANGEYLFTDLFPGTYTIRESQPLGFYDAFDTPGSLGGFTPSNDVLTVDLGDKQNGVEYNFGEVLPASVFGYVYIDQNANGRFDQTETGIANVQITISGTAFAGTALATPLTSALSLNTLTTRTDAFGRWEFPFLPPGNYTIVETQPSGFDDFLERDQDPRPQSGLGVGNDVFSSVRAISGVARGPLNYGELLRRPSKDQFLGSSGTIAGPSSTPPVSTDPGAFTINPSYTTAVGSLQEPVFVVAAASAGRSPLVRVFDYSTGTERFRFFAYEENYTGGVRVATADVDGDGTPDIIAATGQGGGPRVRVFSGEDGTILKDFFAYETNFRGGVFVAAADINGDGKAEIITGTEQGGGPRLTVFDGDSGVRIRDFFAFDSNQRGGIRVAAGDFNGDGVADLMATAGRGTQTIVRVFDGLDASPNPTPIFNVVPYATTFTGGVYIAAGDLDGDGKAEVITAADIGGGPHVQIFNQNGTSRASYFAENSNYRGGIRLAVQDLTGDGKAEIITGTGVDSPAHIKVWNGTTLTTLDDFYAFDAAYTGGVYVG